MKERLMIFVRWAALLLLDLFAYYFALFLAVFVRANIISLFFRPTATFYFSYEYFASIWWIPLILICVISFERLYTIRYPLWEETKVILRSTTITLLFVFFLVSVRNIFADISRLTFVLLWFFLSACMPLIRYWGKRLFFNLGVWNENVLVLGAGESAVNTVLGLISERQLGYNVIGFLDDKSEKSEIEIKQKKYKIYGKIKNYSKFINLLNISTVIISLPELSREELAILTNNVQKISKTVMLVPDLAGIAQINTELHYLFMQKTFLLKINNNLKSSINRIIKTIFDIVLSILILPFLLPIIGVISILIKLDSKGPAFIIQDRLGKDNTVFRCIKFRTMFKDSDNMLTDYFERNPEALKIWNKYKKLKEYDPRVTKIGKILRNYSLDEFPQIFNVLKGEMSLIGPRPYLPREKGDIGDYADLILITKPGMTGLWQISGRNELVFDERLKLDTWYIQNWSLWLDMIILFSTPGALFKRKGAY